MFKFHPSHYRFFMSRLRSAGFEDPVTEEQETYNEYCEYLCKQLEDMLKDYKEMKK